MVNTMLLNPKLFILPSAEINNCGLQNLTYGSLTNRGLMTFVQSIKKHHTGPVYGFDLGCGDGELIYHLQKSIADSLWEGVEISEHRVQTQQRNVNIWQGDMLDENLRPYNILHADNLCLDDIIAEKLENKIAQEFTGLYYTYRTPLSPKFLKTSVYLDTVIAETTWTFHPIRVYRVY